MRARSPMSLTLSAAEMRFAGQILYSFPLTLEFLIPNFNQQIYVSLRLGSGYFINVYINEISNFAFSTLVRFPIANLGRHICASRWLHQKSNYIPGEASLELAEHYQAAFSHAAAVSQWPEKLFCYLDEHRIIIAGALM